VDVVTLQELLPQPAAPVHAVIMAGGFGKRLLPFTEELPKPMLSVDGRPLLERIVGRLRDSGIRQINVTTHFRPEKIVEHFGDGEAFGVDISYVNEDRPLGTGGALGLMPVPDETTLVINGDVLTQVDFRTMLMYHRHHQADMTVAVSQYEIAVPYGVVECEGPQICRLQEKPQLNVLVNAGIYLLEPSVYRFVTNGEALQMTDLITRLLDAGRSVISFPIFEQWLDIGQHADYARAQDLAAGVEGAP
jgi:NDP-sugar pyrophosphorylase family protein